MDEIEISGQTVPNDGTASQDAAQPQVPEQLPTQSPTSNIPQQAVTQKSAQSTPRASDTVANDLGTHPAVQRAGVLHAIAQTLAGRPRVNYIANDDGTVTPQPVPVSRGDIALAIAMEAISGSLSGLAQRGPGATGAAAAAGYQQTLQQLQQSNQQQLQQAQAQATAKASALARQAQIYETNSRTLLNTSEVEARGADALDKLVDINRASGVLDVDPIALDNNGEPMTQAQLMDAMKSGSVSPTDHLGPVAGRVEITNPDGSKRWEATHLVIRDPNTPVDLTQADWDRYASAGVPGYRKGTAIGAGTRVPLRMVQAANEIAAAHYLANGRLDDLRNVLDGTPYANQVPSSVDFTKPGVEGALQRFQKYVSHNSDNLNDPFTALQQMGADRRDPKTGQMQPNPDAKYVSQVADTFGGWSVLEAAHNEIAANKKSAADFAIIDTPDKANAVLAAPKRFSQDQVSAARNFLALANQQGAKKAMAEARARAQAEGVDTQAMYRFGRNPVTGEQLSVSNAPDSMLIDAGGNVIPQDMVSAYKPTAQERQTADTARQVLAISAGLQQAVQANPALAGPLSGRSKAAIAKLGYGDAQAQKFLDNLSFLQTASTRMHTGRFSSEILKKMNNLIQPGMNPDQFSGALSSINDVASRYADEDRLRTVGDYKRQAATPQSPNPAAGRQVQIPAGAQIGRDAQGRIVGYRLNGQFVSIGGNQ